jgi:hypothetical protein
MSSQGPPLVERAVTYCLLSFDFMIWFLFLFFQHSDDDRDSDSEEMQLSSIDLLLETSEIVSFIITLTFSAVIVKLSNFGNAFIYMHHTQSTETQVEEACSLHEKDGIYVDVNADNKTAFVKCHFCPRLKMLLQGFRNNVLHIVQ